MDYLPLFFDLHARDCLLVGGDAVAARKAELLLRAGARLRVVARELGPELERLVASGQAQHIGEAIAREHLEGCTLAIVALADGAEAERAAAAARAAGVPVNAVDRPSLCDAIIPALVDRSPVLVAISTGGAAPVLGRLLRARLEALLPARLGRLAAMARERRPRVSEAIAPDRRRRFWESVLQGPVAELVFAGRDAEAAARMDALLDATSEQIETCGEIYLVSAPADDDPERMSLGGVRLLQQADLVFHEDDLPSALVDLVRRDAERRPMAPGEVDECLSELGERAAAGLRVGWFQRGAAAHAPATLLGNTGAPVYTAGAA